VGNRLRICMIAFMFAPLVGGAEVRAEKQARQLLALGHEVIIVTLRHNKQWKRTEVLDGLPIVRVGGLYNREGILRIGRLGHLPIDLLMLLTLWRLRHSYDLVHSLQLSTLAGMAALVCKLTGKPLVISVASSGPGKQQRPQDATLMADTLQDTSFLKIPYTDITVGDVSYFSQTALGGSLILNAIKKSDAFYQLLSSRSFPYMIKRGFRKDKLFLIPNGVDPDKFSPAPELRPDPTQPERSIICVARLQYPKGIDVLLHAWARMMRASAEWRAQLKPRLVLVGEGPLQAQLERIAAELGIQDSVEFLGLRRDVITLLRQSWGFVMPSRWEGMPNALLEAMSVGLPCIATRVSGSEDIVQDGVNGLLVEPEQPEELAQALRRVIADTELAQHLAQQAHATVLRDYQLSRIIDKCIALYRRVLSQDQNIQPLEPEAEEQTPASGNPTSSQDQHLQPLALEGAKEC
jgi:glycosyltransferase involved in cell wall biosynthesis